MNHDRTVNAVTQLCSEVAVIPGGAEGGGMPSVGASSAVSCNGTFCHTGDTVLVICAFLADAVEVDGCGVVLEVIDKGDIDEISPVGFNDGTRDLAVDGQGQLGTGAIKDQGGIGDGEGILADDAGEVVILGVVRSDGLAVAPLGSVEIVVADFGRVGDHRSGRGGACGGGGGGAIAPARATGFGASGGGWRRGWRWNVAPIVPLTVVLGLCIVPKRGIFVPDCGILAGAHEDGGGGCSTGDGACDWTHGVSASRGDGNGLGRWSTGSNKSECSRVQKKGNGMHG